MSTATDPKPVRIGIVVGSTRVVRVGPQIAAFVRSLVEQDLKTAPVDSLSIEFETVDIGALNLPLFDEPGVPSHTDVPDGYAHEHTRAWSRRVSALDAFIFVTAQHNWGVPAGLKNAIDYLFKEWQGKPFVVVSYGGHGGTHAANALQLILGGGIRMRAADKTVNLSFPSREVTLQAVRGKDLGLSPSGRETIWSERAEDVVQLWRQLVALMTTPMKETKAAA
ncbi:hypothetical protein SEPCBS57363_000926 [Sporothrix epigloea]|uniref:NADPH-dependent FMN reductase-like domain-containing protein n=1 Tax=Sporothrix epigloea TaxID=1892477 RepID=A0ABP0D7H5_9PEZI